MSQSCGVVRHRAGSREREIASRLSTRALMSLPSIEETSAQIRAGSLSPVGVVSHVGPVKNPWNVDYIPGESSGGSAVAVATGMCFATLDTDAVGSCRLPAACCGVVGFKPTYGLISAEGILEGEKADPAIIALAHAAITTRSAADTAVVLRAIGKLDAPSPRKPSLGRVTNFKATKPVRSLFDKTIKTIRRLGFALQNVTAPFDK